MLPLFGCILITCLYLTSQSKCFTSALDKSILLLVLDPFLPRMLQFCMEKFSVSLDGWTSVLFSHTKWWQQQVRGKLCAFNSSKLKSKKMVLSLSLSLSHTHTPSHTHTISAASKPFLIPSLLWHLLNLTQLTHSLSLSCTIYLFYFCLSCLCVWLHLPTSFSLSFTIIELNLQKSHFSLAATIMLNQHLSNPFLSLSCFILELCLYLIFV